MDPVRGAKAELRARLRAGRAARGALPDTPAGLPAAAGALAAAVLDLLADPAVDGPVAAYASLPGEPPTDRLLDALRGVGRGVLLPVLLPDGDLRWAEDRGALVAGLRGTVEPPGPGRGPDAITDCRLVLVPALAAGRDGTRLGQGGGSYDRALSRVPPEVLVVAVVWPEELLDAVPVEPHDRRVGAVLTPRGLHRVSIPAGGEPGEGGRAKNR